MMVARAAPLCSQAQSQLVFEDTQNVRSEFPAGLPCVTWDPDGKAWALYHRASDNGDELVLTRERAIFPDPISAASRGAMVPLADPTKILVVWESPRLDRT